MKRMWTNFPIKFWGNEVRSGKGKTEYFLPLAIILHLKEIWTCMGPVNIGATHPILIELDQVITHFRQMIYMYV